MYEASYETFAELFDPVISRLNTLCMYIYIYVFIYIYYDNPI